MQAQSLSGMRMAQCSWQSENEADLNVHDVENGKDTASLIEFVAGVLCAEGGII